jgi:hypothetical protein
MSFVKGRVSKQDELPAAKNRFTGLNLLKKFFMHSLVICDLKEESDNVIC